jgi:hypothetical protein
VGNLSLQARDAAWAEKKFGDAGVLEPFHRDCTQRKFSPASKSEKWPM